MSSYTASVAVSNGNLTVTRPVAAPDAVQSIVDDLVYAVRSSSGVTSVEVAVTADDAPQAAAGQPAVPAADSGAAADPLAKTTKP